MKIFLIIVAALLSFETIAGPCEKEETEEICGIAFVELLVVPQKYDGKLVAVTGYFKSGFEQSALFESSERAKIEDISSSVWISGSKEAVVQNSKFWLGFGNSLEDCSKIEEGFITVFGRFRIGQSGHMGAYSGLLEISNKCMRRDI
jgi:hypothetical protein